MNRVSRNTCSSQDLGWSHPTREQGMRNLVWRLFVMLIVAATTACAKEYAFTPPVTEDGRQCVVGCQSRQSACRDHQTQNASTAQQVCDAKAADELDQCERASVDEYSQCERESKADYNACLKYASNRAVCHEKICIKEGCFKRGCYHDADLEFCESEFRTCYQTCGGTVGIMK